MKIPFVKMQGLGNDFVVIDATQSKILLTPHEIQSMAHRRLGVGFDQLLMIEKKRNPQADFYYRIFNADGSEVEQCGNGARCVAKFIKERKSYSQKTLILETQKGYLKVTFEKQNFVAVEMPAPLFEPKQIPFLTEQKGPFYHIEVPHAGLVEFGIVNIGNPHAVIRVDHLDSMLVRTVGKFLERHSNFPEGVNVGFMQILSPQRIRLEVYERGVGETLACGSGACAAMVWGKSRGWLQNSVTVSQPGGDLEIFWNGDNEQRCENIKMMGPAEFVFVGEWERQC